MARLHFISQEEQERCCQERIVLCPKEKNDATYAYHFKEAVRIYLENEYGKDIVYQGGLKIYTTINRIMQQAAHEAFIAGCAEVRQQLSLPVDGGLITIDNQSAQIKALVGGFDFKSSSFNRALQAKRQMGSIIKPIVYAIALMQGLKASDT
mgnify:CR=1 FL=1